MSLRTVMDLVRPAPEERRVIFYSHATSPDGGLYDDAQPIEQMNHHFTMLTYDLNGDSLSFGHGAPLRLRTRSSSALRWSSGSRGSSSSSTSPTSGRRQQ